MTKTSSDVIKQQWAKIFAPQRPKRRKKTIKKKSINRKQHKQPQNNNKELRKQTPTFNQKDLHGQIQEQQDRERWGNNPDMKSQNAIRIGFQNIGVQQTSGNSFRSISTSNHISKHPYDAFLFCEHGMNPTKLQPRDHWHERLSQYFSALGYNKNELDIAGTIQYGGTGITLKQELTARKIEHGHDISGLARWTWCRIQGKNQKHVRLVSSYRPIKHADGEESVWSQHLRHWHNEGRMGTDPIQAFDEDLADQLLEWYNLGDLLVIGMDKNHDVRKGPLQSMFDELNMRECITSHHPQKSPPATQNSNKNRTPIDGIWTSRSLTVLSSGYFEFGGACPSDHRGIWVDLDKQEFFGHRPRLMHNPVKLRLSEKDPRIRKRYLKRLKEAYNKSGIHKKFRELQKLYENRQSVDFNEATFSDQYNTLDKEILGIRQDLERKIKKVKAGNVPWSPALKAKVDKVELWRRVTTREQGKATSKTMIRRLIERTGIKEAKDADLQTATLSLKTAYKEYYNFKPLAPESREMHTQRLADTMAESNNTSRAKEIKKMRTIEKQRRQGRTAKRIRKKGGKNAVVKVTSTDEENNTLEYSDQRSLVEACSQSNLKRQLKAHDTPFLQSPLIEIIGYMGEQPAVNDILGGTFNAPNDTDQYSMELLDQMKMPASIKSAGSIDVNITPEEHHNFWRRQSTRTASEPSHLSFAHYKIAAGNKDTCAIDAFLRDAPLQLGFSPETWQQITDVEILKKAQVYDVDKMRLIQLMAAPFNANNKMVGKKMMENGEKHGLLPPDQYGSRKHHQSGMAALNKRITMDIM